MLTKEEIVERLQLLLLSWDEDDNIDFAYEARDAIEEIVEDA